MEVTFYKIFSSLLVHFYTINISICYVLANREQVLISKNGKKRTTLLFRNAIFRSEAEEEKNTLNTFLNDNVKV